MKPLDYNPPGSFFHGVFQARILEWVVIVFFRGSSWPRVEIHVTCVSCIAGGFFTHWTIGEAQGYYTASNIKKKKILNNIF